MLKDGTETEASEAVIQKTTKVGKVNNIVDYGAKDTGKIVNYKGREDEIEANTKAIQKAIDECEDGGKVVIPKGIYTSGALWLKSNMTLELEEGAVLSGSTNVDDYEQNYLLRDYSTDRRSWGLINAYSKDGSIKNVRIVGEGKIDGNGWKYDHGNNVFSATGEAYKEKDYLDPEGDEYRLTHFGYGSNMKAYDENSEENTMGLLAADAVKKALADGYTRAQAYSTRPTLMILKGVEGLYLEDVTVTNPAFHGISIGDCDNVVVNSIKDLTYNDNNGDGIGLDSSKNCLVMNNFFDTGDDAINFASGLGSLSKFNRSVSDVRIINNFVRRSHGGIIAAGSHTGAWIENILAEDNVSNHSDTPFRFKSNPVNGGGVRNVVIRDSAAAKPNTQAFIFTTQYSDENQILQFEPAPSVAEFYGITIDNVTVEGENKASVGAIDVKGKLSDGHRDIKFTNVKFKNFAKGANISGLSNSEFNNVTFEGNKLPLEKQWNIQDSRNLKFEGSTVENASIKDAKEIPAFDESAKIIAKEEEKSVTLTWDKAIDNTAVSNYVIKTYVNDNLVHESTVEGNTTTYTEEGLLPGTIYKFTVEGKDEAGNVTEKKLVIIAKTVDGVVEAIKVPTDKTVSIVGESGYTWTNISWNACDDATVRKYEIYANGIKVNEVLNPTLRNLIKDGKISTNVSGLNQGSDNTITVKAVNDRGDVFEYTPVVARTWDHFDRFAPSFSSDAKLNVEVKGDTVELSWSEATDDSGILGYRVYMNGICLGEGKFN